MIFLDMAPESIGDPINADGYISVEEMRRYKADVTYLLAYNYFLLFEFYGPTPIIPETADPSDENLDYARASGDEMVGHIDQLLESLISGEYRDDLPETIKTGTGDDSSHDNSMYNLREILRPTKAAALALRARLWVYAASPLFNGGYQEALTLTNHDGKRLFPDRDANKWQTAKTHLEALLRFADSKKVWACIIPKIKDPHASIYELFQYYNDEILWAGNNDYNDGTSPLKWKLVRFPETSLAVWVMCFYQNIVDLFFTNSGLDINEDPDYNENGFTDWANICNEKTCRQAYLQYVH